MADRMKHPGRSGRAGNLLDRADGLLLQAAAEPDPRERFRTAYLAALRGAGAVLALTGADRAPRARSRNAWVLMQQAAPEFVMWSDYFSAHSETRAALEAGLDRPVDAARADEFASRVGAFLHDVEDLVSAAARLRPIPGWVADGTA
ncbi:SAV_6107 family HEPN domain-containing protein [Nocardia sp. CDC159]|uniref:SAV_6107 family HEPN domain-containing protein n=1 Tax=Nocardia pulmonis TaxID=2951408 RepID=A0A9X2E3T5_9NOCA|nr:MULTISPECIES: SAV_6107 family HEPN domain-containing protein [Nocardia]MCM6773344.1 SAV_6107 family HEPN domain-containing protein [Nocardia pulmonis]MCM6786231.1 SAV_6107 family HEPN domain-containing protein [Nocardia sp. CDC159]